MRWGIAESWCQESGQREQELPSGEGTQITLCVWPLRGHLYPGLLSQVLGPRLPETAFPGEHSQLCFWGPTLPSASRSLGILTCAVWG